MFATIRDTECSKSELDLFSIPPTQSSIQNNIYTRVSPLTAVTNALAPIEFIIKASSEHFIDPSDIFLYLKISIKNRDATKLKDLHKLYFENNIFHSMFSDVEVFLNETKITSGGNNYAYRAFFENLFNFSKDEKDSKLVCEGFYSEKDRKQIISRYYNLSEKSFEGYGRLHSDIFFQPRLILSGCDMKIKLHRNSTTFCIKSDAVDSEKTDLDPSKIFLSVEDIYLDVRKVQLSSQQHLNIERQLNNSAAKYPITRVDIKTFSISSGISRTMINHVVNGKLPSRIMFGLIPHSAYNGDIFESGLNFNHNNLITTGIYINGCLFSQFIKCEYSDSNSKLSNHVRAYHKMFSELASDGDIVDLKYDEFKNNYCIYIFDLTQDRCVNPVNHVNPVLQGDLSVYVEFSKELQKNLTLIAYIEFPGIIQVDKPRQAYVDF